MTAKATDPQLKKQNHGGQEMYSKEESIVIFFYPVSQRSKITTHLFAQRESGGVQINDKSTIVQLLGFLLGFCGSKSSGEQALESSARLFRAEGLLPWRRKPNLHARARVRALYANRAHESMQRPCFRFG